MVKLMKLLSSAEHPLSPEEMIAHVKDDWQKDSNGRGYLNKEHFMDAVGVFHTLSSSPC